MNNKELKQLTKLTTEAEAVLNKAAEKMQLSARAYMRSIKAVRTIADLDSSTSIEVPHLLKPYSTDHHACFNTNSSISTLAICFRLCYNPGNLPNVLRSTYQ